MMKNRIENEAKSQKNENETHRMEMTEWMRLDYGAEVNVNVASD